MIPIGELGRRGLRFGLVGVLNTLVGLGTIYAAKAALGMPDVPANALGYVLGLACSFVLNRRFTFEQHGPVWSSLMRFLAAFCIAWLVNIGVVLLLINGGRINAYLAHALALPIYTALFFLLSQYWVFRPDAECIPARK